MQVKSWEHSRVLITGSSGFIGRHLISFLRKKKAIILGLSRRPIDTSVERRADVTNKKDVWSFFSQFRPHVCFHLASESLVETGAQKPHETFSNNIEGALHILEAARTFGIQRLIVASTSHVYGDAQLPFKEIHPARPSRPYETSKTCVDLIAQSYADSFNLPVLIPRFVNVYGPGDINYSRIIPKTMKSVINGINPTMWGGNATREYLYIDDAISAYNAIAKITDAQLENNRIYNVGTGIPITVKDLVQRIIVMSKKDLHIKKIEPVRAEELQHQYVSSDKIKRTLDWRPKYSLEVGLKKTYAWYLTND